MFTSGLVQAERKWKGGENRKKTRPMPSPVRSESKGRKARQSRGWGRSLFSFPPFFRMKSYGWNIVYLNILRYVLKTCNNKIVWCFCAQSLPSVPSRYDWKICHKFAVCLLFYAILSFTHGNTSFKKNKYGNFYKFKKHGRKAHRLMNACPLGWSLFVELEWEEKYHVVFPSKSLQDIYFQYISLLYQLNPQKQKCTITV